MNTFVPKDENKIWSFCYASIHDSENYHFKSGNGTDIQIRVALKAQDIAECVNEVTGMKKKPPCSHPKLVYPFMLNMRMEWTAGYYHKIRIVPSIDFGNRVVAQSFIPRGTIVTTYPIHALRVWLDKMKLESPIENRCYVMFYHDNTIKNKNLADRNWSSTRVQVHKRYDMSVFANPRIFNERACGHILTKSAFGNCRLQIVSGGVIMLVEATEDIKPGRELAFHHPDSMDISRYCFR